MPISRKHNTSSKKDFSFAEAMHAVLGDVAGVRSSRGEKKKNALPFGHLERYSTLDLRVDAQSPTQPTQLQHDVEGFTKWLPSYLSAPSAAGSPGALCRIRLTNENADECHNGAQQGTV